MIRRWLGERAYQRWLREMPVEAERDDYTVCDWAPEDLIDCGTCGGHGVVIMRVDWETGNQDIEKCLRCYGTGLDPSQVPHWAVALA